MASHSRIRQAVNESRKQRKKQSRKGINLMDTDLHLWFFIFYNKEYIFDVLGGQGWSRTTVLGFSVRHTDRVCHLPIYKTQKEKIVGFEPTTF